MEDEVEEWVSVFFCSDFGWTETIFDKEKFPVTQFGKLLLLKGSQELGAVCYDHSSSLYIGFAPNKELQPPMAYQAEDEAMLFVENCFYIRCGRMGHC